MTELATVSLLIGAKLNQPLSPSFKQMILLLKDEYKLNPNCKKNLINLEHNIVKSLQFDMQI
jgi:hypothetical protein